MDKQTVTKVDQRTVPDPPESGDFAHSEPDFASNTDIMNVRNILPTESTEEYTETYDLQGRRLTGEPAKGIYIQNGRKVLVK